jgi:hypothetical protein
MNTWFCKNLGDAMLAFLELDHFEAVCLSAYKTANSPKEMAVFHRHESEGRLHCELIVYFSPAMVHIAGELGATPCKQPTKHGLSLFVGSAEAWAALFFEG